VNAAAALPKITFQPLGPPAEVAGAAADALALPQVEFARNWSAESGAAAGAEGQRSVSVLSLRVPKPKLGIRSFSFSVAADGKSTPAAPAGNSNSPARQTQPARSAAKRPASRIRPPRDVVKLADRLFYVLQPPLESLFNSEQFDFPFEPFPYQYEGVAFLYPQHTAILADEMGLGKTMQAITTVRLLLRRGEVRSVLLVCPKPLVTNWQREFALWAPEIPVTVVEGDQARRHWQWRLPRSPVRIANYELLTRDEDVLLDESLHFDLVLLDEAQRIKNRRSATSRVARGISRSRSWALTGTPVENSTEDLVGIFEFLSPGYLHEEMSARQMGQAARGYILRRTKDQVLDDMPPKLFRDADLELTGPQRASYEMAEKEGVVQLADMGQEVTIQHVFELVLRLKQICNFDPATGASAKLERLQADLEEVAASGQKAIIFSQWVSAIEQIAAGLAEYQPLQYHGKVPSKQRDAVLDRFKNDERHRVLLMSYGAGSVGLNLQFVRYVFLFDRWWNPAVEDQAINRAHRIGAAGPVTVSRFLTLGSIEERIDQVLQEKRELFDTIFESHGRQARHSFSRDEVFGLFDLKAPPATRQAA